MSCFSYKLHLVHVWKIFSNILAKMFNEDRWFIGNTHCSFPISRATLIILLWASVFWTCERQKLRPHPHTLCEIITNDTRLVTHGHTGSNGRKFWILPPPALTASRDNYRHVQAILSQFWILAPPALTASRDNYRPCAGPTEPIFYAETGYFEQFNDIWNW